MTKRDLVAMSQAIATLQKEKAGVKFAYAVARNAAKLKDEIAALAAAEDASRGEYERLRLALCAKHCTKGEQGKPIMVDGRFAGLADHAEFQAELKALVASFE